MSSALFIGRFQPLHKGHLVTIKEVMKKHRKLTITIAATNKLNSDNPFTFKERAEMVRLCFGNKVKIIGIHDMEHDRHWTNYLLKKEKFDVVVTGNPWVKGLFHKLKKIESPRFVNPEKYSGIKIREKIYHGRQWKDLVPTKVAKYLEKIDGVNRIRLLSHVG